MTGCVHLVGAGPGAADLLTLRAVRLLGAADIVLHDALVSEEILAHAATARKLNVGKRANRPSTDQAFINRLLVRCAERYRTVVRLKGGDPMMFGRAQEEIDFCRARGVSVVVTPGVSAAFAAAADAGVSLTHRLSARSVTFVTPATARGAEPDESWADAAAAADVAVIYMGKSQLARVRDALLARGLPAGRPALLVENASRVEARVIGGALGELQSLAQRMSDGPALLVLGEHLSAVAARALATSYAATA
jgi:uroporphyrin-III C-methyltransferase